MTDSPSLLPIVPAAGCLLTAAAYQRLADMPPELEWFANLGSSHAAPASTPRPISCDSPVSGHLVAEWQGSATWAAH